MTETAPVRPDTSDMAAVHRVFRSSLASAPEFVASAAGDGERRAMIANYYANILAFLEAHHEGEQALIFPVLVERAPGQRGAVDRAQAEHDAVAERISSALRAVELWTDKGDDAAPQTLRSLDELSAALLPHLDEEEATIVPLAAEHMTAEEWGLLPGHALAHFGGDKVWLIMGLIRENFTEAQRDAMLAHMPAPARQMWESMGERAFGELIAEVRAVS